MIIWLRKKLKKLREDMRQILDGRDDNAEDRQMSNEMLRLWFQTEPVNAYISTTLVVWGMLALLYQTYLAIFKQVFITLIWVIAWLSG